MAAPKGHQYAKRKGIWTSALKRAIARQGEGDWRRGLDELASKMIAAAHRGDQWALSHIADRLEGKAAETVHVEATVVHVEEVSSRTLVGTLRRVDDPETPRLTVQ